MEKRGEYITRFENGDTFVFQEKTIYVGSSTADTLNTGLGLVSDKSTEAVLKQMPVFLRTDPDPSFDDLSHRSIETTVIEVFRALPVDLSGLKK